MFLVQSEDPFNLGLFFLHGSKDIDKNMKHFTDFSSPAVCVTGIPGTTTRDRTLKFDFIFVFLSGVEELTENYCYQIMTIMIVITVIITT